MKTDAGLKPEIDNGELALAAEVALDRLGVAAGDAFLVVSNPDLVEIAGVLAEAARARTRNVRIQEFPPTSRDGEEPPDAVATAMRAATAIAIVTRFSLSHTEARRAATRAGARIASLPGVTEEIFARTLPIDYTHLERVGRALAAKLTEAKLCRVTAAGGTNVQVSLHGRQAICDDGDLRAPGAWGNLPAGEAFIAPIESDGRGTIVFDGSLAGWGLLAEPLSIELEQGRAVTAAGGAAAKWLLDTLDAGGEYGRTIAELGIGTNPGAMITGVILEDEKAEGTVHFAFGTNTGIGGANRASVHIDGLVREAIVELDGRPILCNGRLVDSRDDHARHTPREEIEMGNEVLTEPSATDFDFWMGRWNVHNRRLRRRLAGADEWDEFEATVLARPILGGMGNEDEFRTDYDGGFIGMSFRFFDPAKGRWSIYWADSRRCGELDPPVFGTFSGDTGVFEGTDVFEGRPILVRYTWSGITTPTLRWEQAFSDSGGETWETNWIMEITRAEDDS